MTVDVRRVVLVFLAAFLFACDSDDDGRSDTNDAAGEADDGTEPDTNAPDTDTRETQSPEVASDIDEPIDTDLPIDTDEPIDTDLPIDTDEPIDTDLPIDTGEVTSARVTICHLAQDGTAEALVVGVDEIADHFAHGDPVGLLADVLFVDDDPPAGALTLATRDAPLTRIGDALALARCGHRATGARHVIDVAPGRYRMSLDADALAADATLDAAPLVIDFPVHLFGHTSVAKDGSGVPLGDYTPYLDPATSTILAPDRALASADEALVLVADSADVRLEHLALRSGHCRQQAHCPDESPVTTRNGMAVVVLRATGVALADLVAFPGFNSAFEGRSSDLVLSGSFASDTAICVACMSDDGRYEVHHNRFENGLGGVLVAGGFGAATVALGTQTGRVDSDSLGVVDPRVDALIADNVLVGHTRNGNAFGVRIFAFGPGAAGHVADVSLTARVLGNTMELPDGSAGVHNGVLLDAGFATRGPAPLSATMFLEVADNTITAVRKPVVAITGRAQVITNNNAADWRTYGVLDDGAFVIDTDLAFPDAFWIDHFAADPLADLTTSGSACAADLDCSTATWRGTPLPGVCSGGTCACAPSLDAGEDGLCHDPSPPHFNVLVDGHLVDPGTAIP